MRDRLARLVALSALAFTALIVAGCGELVDESRARATLADESYKNITITAKHGILPADWFGCSGGDDVAFKAAATNAAGKHTEVTVCCGWGVVAAKGCTIRH